MASVIFFGQNDIFPNRDTPVANIISLPNVADWLAGDRLLVLTLGDVAPAGVEAASGAGTFTKVRESGPAGAATIAIWSGVATADTVSGQIDLQTADPQAACMFVVRGMSDTPVDGNGYANEANSASTIAVRRCGVVVGYMALIDPTPPLTTTDPLTGSGTAIEWFEGTDDGLSTNHMVASWEDTKDGTFTFGGTAYTPATQNSQAWHAVDDPVANVPLTLWNTGSRSM